MIRKIFLLLSAVLLISCAELSTKNDSATDMRKKQADHEWCVGHATYSNMRMQYNPQTYKECMEMLGH